MIFVSSSGSSVLVCQGPEPKFNQRINSSPDLCSGEADRLVSHHFLFDVCLMRCSNASWHALTQGRFVAYLEKWMATDWLEQSLQKCQPLPSCLSCTFQRVSVYFKTSYTVLGIWVAKTRQFLSSWLGQFLLHSLSWPGLKTCMSQTHLKLCWMSAGHTPPRSCSSWLPNWSKVGWTKVKMIAYRTLQDTKIQPESCRQDLQSTAKVQEFFTTCQGTAIGFEIATEAPTNATLIAATATKQGARHKMAQKYYILNSASRLITHANTREECSA